MKLVLLLAAVAFCAGPSVAEPAFFNSLTSGISKSVDTMKQTASSATSASLNAAKTAASTATSTAANAASSATNLAKATATSATNAATSAVNKGMDLAKSASMVGVNAGVKLLLEQMKLLVKSSGHGRLEIADIDHKMGPIHFNATKGYFGDISTIKVDGEIDMKVQNMTMVISVPLALATVDAGYQKFEVGMWKIKSGGGINIHIGEDSFNVTLRVKAGLTCAINVEKVEVAKFGNIDIDFTDMGSKSEWVMEKAANIITKMMKETIKSKVQDALDSSLKKVLTENGSICSKFIA